MEKENTTKTYESPPNERETFRKKDQIIVRLCKSKNGFNKLLDYYAIQLPYREVHKDVIAFSIKPHPHAPPLPFNYGFKGGMARFLIETYLKKPNVVLPRDIDIVRIGELPGVDYAKWDRIVSECYMPQDYANGHGVEVLNPNESHDYFHTRDFTINEVLVMGDTAYATRLGFMDIYRGVIRLSEFEKSQADVHHSIPNGKLLAKSVRMLAEAYAKGDYTRYLADEAMLRDGRISPFHMALHLDRAMQRGEEAVQNYIHFLRAYNHLPADIQTVAEAKEYIDDNLEYSFTYSLEEKDFNPDTQELELALFAQEEQPSDPFITELEELPPHAPMKGARQQG